MKKSENACSDLKRMSAGRLYNCTDKEVFLKHAKALYLTDRFNRSQIWNVPKRNRIIKKLIPSHGKNFFFMQTFRCEYGFNISFGKDLFVNFDCIFMDVAPIKIGDSVMFGPRVTIATPTHPLVASERVIQQYPDGYHGIEYAKPVTIGNGVWVAANVTICGGVNIGDGAVIAAGSVVTRDIPPNCIAAGAPCKVVRFIDENDRLNVWETYSKDLQPMSDRDKNRANK